MKKKHLCLKILLNRDANPKGRKKHQNFEGYNTYAITLVRVSITLVIVEITLERVKITFMRVEITLERLV
jgi:hypothetical protein